MDERYETRLRLLSEKSVHKHFDAYRDIDWDAPEMKIEPDDPRWELDREDPLGRTSWYRELPAQLRSRLGLHSIVHQMKVGVQFENILTRGLLELAHSLPHNAPEVRYAYHEAIEESQHSLMFLELIRRSGIEVHGIHGFEWRVAQRVPKIARRFPEKFFVHVLAGEAPIDHVQRKLLRRPADSMPPILRRIIQIHVIEEARHLSFAHSFLEKNAPRLTGVKRLSLQLSAPVILTTTRAQMIQLPAEIIAAYDIPEPVVLSVRRVQSSRGRALEGLESVRRLCLRSGLIPAAFVPWWKLLGMWPTEHPSLPAAA